MLREILIAIRLVLRWSFALGNEIFLGVVVPGAS